MTSFADVIKAIERTHVVDLDGFEAGFELGFEQTWTNPVFSQIERLPLMAAMVVDGASVTVDGTAYYVDDRKLWNAIKKQLGRI